MRMPETFQKKVPLVGAWAAPKGKHCSFALSQPLIRLGSSILKLSAGVSLPELVASVYKCSYHGNLFEWISCSGEQMRTTSFLS